MRIGFNFTNVNYVTYELLYKIMCKYSNVVFLFEKIENCRILFKIRLTNVKNFLFEHF